MKKRIFFAIMASLVATGSLSAQVVDEPNGDAAMKYRRSSLYSVLIKHSAYPYAEEIESAFMLMPMPDKFNDHNLSIRTFESSAQKMKKKSKKKTEGNVKDINQFFADNNTGQMLVSKWFNRNPVSGGFDMGLIQERGFYDASQLDISLAKESARGILALGDAGEELIGNTFVIVNDITFVDKGERSGRVAGVIKTLGDVVSTITDNDNYQLLGDMVALTTNEIDGFSVNITTYLYKLKWNEEIQSSFYQDYWFNSGEMDTARKKAFDESDLFTMEYVGQTMTSAANLSSKSFSKKSKEEQMLRVCTRAVDNAIVELQREYDEFKVKVPIYKMNEGNKTVEVQIGLKEGVNEKSRYEVLMPLEDEKGNTTYKKVGMLKPIGKRIWDNRFGALEEAREAVEEKAKDAAASLEAASLDATTFKIVSGADKIVPGCLVREVTIKRSK